jgi:hypothetical protein
VGAFLGNNFFLIIVLLMADEPRDRPSSTAIFYLTIGLLYAIPLANDLTLRIPAERFALWPLSCVARVVVHIVNLAMNPLVIVAVLFASLSRHPAVRVGLLASGIVAPLVAYAFRFAARKLGRLDYVSLVRLVARFPGRLGGLTQNRLRGQLRLLDSYFAAALSIGGVAYRLFGPPLDAMAPLVIGHMIVITLSTLAQPHLAFDAAQEEVRAGLLPISGPALLLAKDAAWFALAALLLGPYASLAVGVAAVTTLTVAHTAAAREKIEQRRANFASGTLWPTGIGQLAGIVVAGVATFRFGLTIAPLFAAAYTVSLIWYGRKRSAVVTEDSNERFERIKSSDNNASKPSSTCSSTRA